MKNSDCDQRIEIDVRMAPGSDRHELNLQLSTQEPMNQIQQAFWDETLNKISNVANHGGLCGANNNPTSSIMTVASTRDARSLELVYQVSAKGIDKGAWRVIVGILISASSRMFPLRRLELVSCNLSETDRADAGHIFAIPYPSYQSSVPFELEVSEERDASHRLIQLQFANKPGSIFVQELLDTFLSWEVCLWGGFPLESDPPLYNGANKVEVYLADSHTFALIVRDYYGSDDAFNCIISMAVWFHLQALQVRKVIVE